MEYMAPTHRCHGSHRWRVHQGLHGAGASSSSSQELVVKSASGATQLRHAVLVVKGVTGGECTGAAQPRHAVLVSGGYTRGCTHIEATVRHGSIHGRRPLRAIELPDTLMVGWSAVSSATTRAMKGLVRPARAARQHHGQSDLQVKPVACCELSVRSSPGVPMAPSSADGRVLDAKKHKSYPLVVTLTIEKDNCRGLLISAAGTQREHLARTCRPDRTVCVLLLLVDTTDRVVAYTREFLRSLVD